MNQIDMDGANVNINEMENGGKVDVNDGINADEIAAAKTEYSTYLQERPVSPFHDSDPKSFAELKHELKAELEGSGEIDLETEPPLAEALDTGLITGIVLSCALALIGLIILFFWSHRYRKLCFEDKRRRMMEGPEPLPRLSPEPVIQAEAALEETAIAFDALEETASSAHIYVGLTLAVIPFCFVIYHFYKRRMREPRVSEQLSPLEVRASLV